MATHEECEEHYFTLINLLVKSGALMMLITGTTTLLNSHRLFLILCQVSGAKVGVFMGSLETHRVVIRITFNISERLAKRKMSIMIIKIHFCSVKVRMQM